MTGASGRVRFRLAAVGAVCGLLVANPGAWRQQSAAPASGGDPVGVDFLAVSASGAPVTDLRAEEITLRVDGRPRPLKSLQWVRLAATPTETDAARLPAAPAPFGTNVLADSGRTLILVLDNESYRPGREGPLRQAVSLFLNRLGPLDRVALVTLPYGGLKVDLTAEHSRVSQAMAGMVGQAPQNETGSELACRTRRTLESLTGLLDSLAGGGAPAMVLFFSAGLAGPRRDAVISLAPGMCELTTDQFERVGIASSRARAYFYVVLPEEVNVQGTRSVENIAGTGFIGSDDPRAGLEHLTGVTGGFQLPLATARESNLTRVARETSGYYLATFDPEPSDRNGARHQIDVRVSRDGVVSRMRPAIIIPRPNAKVTRTRITPREMLRDASVFRDLPLRVIGYTSLNEDDAKRLKILTLGEPIDPAVKLTAAAAGLFDANGRLTAQWTANPEELSASPLMAALVVPPGAYRLRLAATDLLGRSGTADYPLVAELAPVGSLTVSGLVLGLSRSGGFRPAFQFSAEPVAIGYLEVYGPPPDAPIAVVFEIALSANGPAMISTPAAVAATREPLRRTATAAIPIGALNPGEYVVRALVSTSGQAAGRVERTLRKVAR